MTINTKTCIFVSLLLPGGLGSGNGTFDFGCGINLSCRGIAMVELWGIVVAPVVSGPILAASKSYCNSCQAPIFALSTEYPKCMP